MTKVSEEQVCFDGGCVEDRASNLNSPMSSTSESSPDILFYFWNADMCIIFVS